MEENKNRIPPKIPNETLRPSNASTIRGEFSVEKQGNQMPEDDFDNDGIYSGISLNDILNKNKKRNEDNAENSEEEMGFYATNLINEIKKKNAKKAKKLKLAILISVLIFLFVVLLLFGFLPKIQDIAPIN